MGVLCQNRFCTLLGSARSLCSCRLLVIAACPSDGNAHCCGVAPACSVTLNTQQTRAIEQEGHRVDALTTLEAPRLEEPLDHAEVGTQPSCHSETEPRCP